ncbi:secreted frizzled-related protein 2-like [Xiphophorus couchianus]|uniref:secreted frizzled-related protein 2-like n=1 Tax=Xiphophorus couchianus TaxID=32473 RepID=UPI001016AFE6|nr:secreted frizzled-related protein 2-like [Xiphophorus couchianus]
MSVFVLSSLMLFSVVYASDPADPVLVGPPTIVFSSSFRSVCKPIPSTLSLCQGIGYQRMWIPNLLGHDSLKEAKQQSAAWLPLVSKLCHQDTKKFLCSLFAPVCLPELGEPVSPCKSLCEAVRDGCVPVMSAFGFPWPEMFNCSRFPSGTELCIPSTGQLEERTDEEVRREEELKESIICDACALTAEGESDIQQNFCHSPYAIKMRLDSVSTLGGDRQLVPVARSRILRWAGGGAERAQEFGGATTHRALWLQEGGSCTCPGLDLAETNNKQEQNVEPVDKKKAKRGGRLENRPKDGWFLALAQAEEGRLILTRLVKWTREDKELKKFIRSLLKKPCPEL